MKKEILLENLYCERLSSRKVNNSLIKDFTSRKSLELPVYLKLHGWLDDMRNIKAVYLVKDKNKIVGYFSLECGLLAKCHKKVIGGIVKGEMNGESGYFIDQDAIEVTEAVPAMELSLFCINDAYRSKHNDTITCGIEQYSLGAYVFYKFIAPIVLSTASVAGLRFLYLYCADDVLHRLSNYYLTKLNFRRMDDMACVRPHYDEKLDCYTISISQLQNDVERFQDYERVPLILEMLAKGGVVTYSKAKHEYHINDPQFLFEYLDKHGLALVDQKHKKQGYFLLKCRHKSE